MRLAGCGSDLSRRFDLFFPFRIGPGRHEFPPNFKILTTVSEDLSKKLAK
jgi:hypothetical protein